MQVQQYERVLRFATENPIHSQQTGFRVILICSVGESLAECEIENTSDYVRGECCHVKVM